jgi:hypothetical protein
VSLIVNSEEHLLRALADTGASSSIILEAYTSAPFIKLMCRIIGCKPVDTVDGTPVEAVVSVSVGIVVGTLVELVVGMSVGAVISIPVGIEVGKLFGKVIGVFLGNVASW